MVLTDEMMDAARGPKGGWSREQLAILGVKWPLGKGWRKRLLGKTVSTEAAKRFVDYHKPKEVESIPSKEDDELEARHEREQAWKANGYSQDELERRAEDRLRKAGKEVIEAVAFLIDHAERRTGVDTDRFPHDGTGSPLLRMLAKYFRGLL